MSVRRFVAGREELLADGFTGSRLKNWRRSRRLTMVIRGVYSYGRDIETPEAVWRAALVAAGPDSVLTGVSACELWGIVKPRNRLPRTVAVATAGGKARTLNGLSPALSSTRVEIVHRCFETGDIRMKDGLPLVRAAWALIDFAVDARERDVRFAFLEACRLKLFGKPDVAYCYRRIIGRRGAKKLRPLLAMWIPELGRVKSVFEGLFLLACVGNKSEIPEVNVRVGGYEVDCFWRTAGVVLELDGAAFHGDPLQRRIDLDKQRRLEALGLLVIRLTYAEFDADPAAAARRIAATVAARSEN